MFRDDGPPHGHCTDREFFARNPVRRYRLATPSDLDIEALAPWLAGHKELVAVRLSKRHGRRAIVTVFGCTPRSVPYLNLAKQRELAEVMELMTAHVAEPVLVRDRPPRQSVWGAS